MPRPKGPAELIEARRHQALRLLDEGYTLNEVGRMVDSAASSVMRWRDAREREGEKGLRVRVSPGRPATLTPAQRKRLVKLLLKGALANGFATELWTTARVGTLIQRHCRAQFHRSHVARLLHDLGFSCQKPERRALERDEARIEQWKRSEWPRVKKTLRGWVPTLSVSTSRASC
jgi:transposase